MTDHMTLRSLFSIFFFLFFLTTYYDIKYLKDLSKLSIFHKKYCPKMNDSRLLQIKSALSGLRQFLAIETPLKMMKNAFYFTSKADFYIFVLTFW